MLVSELIGELKKYDPGYVVVVDGEKCILQASGLSISRIDLGDEHLTDHLTSRVVVIETTGIGR